MMSNAPNTKGALALSDRADGSSLNRGPKLAAAGGIIGALAASSCCILPVVLFSLGIGGAWIGSFTQLAPYQPYFIAVTLVFTGAGYWLGYPSSKLALAQGEACARPLSNRVGQRPRIPGTVPRGAVR